METNTKQAESKDSRSSWLAGNLKEMDRNVKQKRKPIDDRPDLATHIEDFNMHAQYRMLSTYPRCEKLISNPGILGNTSHSDAGSGEKRGRLPDENDFDFNTSSHGSYSPLPDKNESPGVNSSLVRPPDVKKSKKKRKAKLSRDFEETTNAVFELFLRKEKAMKAKEELIDKKTMHLLAKKPNLTEMEQRYLTMLMRKYGS